MSKLLQYTNLVRTTLAADITAGATTITVADGTFMAAPVNGQYQSLMLQGAADSSKLEFVLVTARAGNSLTVIRAQENTTAQAFSTSDLVLGRVSKGFFDDLVPQGYFLYDTSIADHSVAATRNSLKYIIDAAGATVTTILLQPGTYTVADNLTIPANITLKPLPGAILNVSSGKTITFTAGSSVDAGPYQWFSGSGTVAGTITNTYSYMEWFGGGESLDSGAAANKCLIISDEIAVLEKTYLVETTIILNSGQGLKGKSSAKSILKMKDGVGDTVIESINFSTLTGQNKWFVDTDGVPHGMYLYSLQIDGNRDNNGAGNCVSWYAKRYYIDDVIIRQSPGVGLYTECGDVVGQHDWRDMPDSWINLLYIRKSVSHGWQHRGAHDTSAGYVTSNNNGGWGILTEKTGGTFTGGGLNIDLIHTYSNVTGGVRFNAQAQCQTVLAESETPCIQIDANNTLIQRAFIFNNEVSGGGTFGDGIQVKADFVTIGTIRASLSAGSLSTHAGVRVESTALHFKCNNAIINGNGSAATGVSIEAVDASNRANNSSITGGSIFDFSGTGGIGLSYGSPGVKGVRFGQMDMQILNCATCMVYENDDTRANMLNISLFTNAGQTALSGDPPSTDSLHSDRLELIAVGDTNSASKTKGTATLNAGGTTVVVTHSNLFTPALQDIQVTPSTTLRSASYFWVDTITATTFTINVNADPASGNVGFIWWVNKDS